MFHASGGYLLAVNFLSHSSNLGAWLDRIGLNSNFLVDLHKIVCKDDDNPLTKVLTITKSAESFIWEKELERFAVAKHFKFNDGSTLTIPQLCLKKFYL